MANTNNNMRFQRQGYSNMRRSSCSCVTPMPVCPYQRERDILRGMPIAMAYVPWQEWRNIYEIQKGFRRGTIFEELDKPFQGKGGCNR